MERDVWPYQGAFGSAAESRCISRNITLLSGNTITIWHLSERNNKMEFAIVGKQSDDRQWNHKAFNFHQEPSEPADLTFVKRLEKLWNVWNCTLLANFSFSNQQTLEAVGTCKDLYRQVHVTDWGSRNNRGHLRDKQGGRTNACS